MFPWWGLAIYISFMMAIRANVNSVLQLEGVRARTWDALFSALLLSPSLWLAEWPQETTFYVCLLFTGVFLSIATVRMVDMSAQFGGPITTLARPLQILFVFLMWSLVASDSLTALMENPLRATGVAISFVLAGLAQWRLYQHKMELKDVLKELLFVAVVFSMTSVIIKFALAHTHSMAQAVLWACLQMYMIFFVCLVRTRLQETQGSLFEHEIVIGGVKMAVLTVMAAPVFMLALRAAPNPAYVPMVGMLSTVWLMIYYAFKKQDSHMQAMPVICMIGGAVILIISTQGL